MNGPRRNFMGAVLVSMTMLGVSFLAGCGFQPLYGDYTRSGSDVTADLAQVEIAIGNNREGQILYNFLLDRFNPKGKPVAPSFALSSTITVSSQSLGTQIDESTVRARLIASVQAVLSDKASGEAWSFTSEAIVGYSTTEDVYAAQVSEDGALEQALRSISDDLRIQVATFIEKRRLLGA